MNQILETAKTLEDVVKLLKFIDARGKATIEEIKYIRAKILDTIRKNLNPFIKGD